MIWGKEHRAKKLAELKYKAKRELVQSKLQLLRAELERYGLRPALSMGNSHACWAQWWAYEAFYDFENGRLGGVKQYISMSMKELDSLRGLVIR